MSALAPEARLILACVSVGDDRAARDRILALVHVPIDWDRAIALAAEHGVAPLFYSRITSAAAESLPPAPLQRLRALIIANAMRTERLERELVRVMDTFAAAGIGALSYKGPALARLAYGGVAMRQFVDLDILIRKPDAVKAAGLLAALGFEHRLDFDALDGGPLQACKDVFSRPGDLCQIDLHWDLNPRYFPFSPESGSLWSRATTVDVGGRAIATPAPLDLMLLLCVHASRHGWTSLAMVSDVARLLIACPIDCAALMRAATGLRASRMVLLGLLLARDLLDAPVTSELAARANGDAAVKSLAARVTRRLFAAQAESVDSQPWSVPLRTIERTRDRIRYIADRALSPTVDDWQFIELPRPLFLLYYAVRPLRLTLRLGRSIGGRAASSPAPACR